MDSAAPRATRTMVSVIKDKKEKGIENKACGFRLGGTISVEGQPNFQFPASEICLTPYFSHLGR